MEWKLFFSTFALIFLAELGDKTQLAAFAATAGSRSPWAVFVGASVALVLSTLIAVVFGSAIQRVLPPVYLKLAAGVLFLIFGVLLLASGLRSQPEPSAETAPASGEGVLARFAFALAAEFEKAASADYDKLARATTDPRLRVLLTALAEEERSHLDKVKHALSTHGETPMAHAAPDAVAALSPDVSAVDKDRDGVKAQAVEHEKTTAAFYEELARTVPVRSLKGVFAQLATEERDHARRLEEC